MELNLYGIASIQLDRLKGRQVRRILAYFACSSRLLYFCCQEVQTQFTEYLILVQLPARAEATIYLEWFDSEPVQIAGVMAVPQRYKQCPVSSLQRLQADNTKTLKCTGEQDCEVTMYQGFQISAFQVSLKTGEATGALVTVTETNHSPFFETTIYKYVNMCLVLLSAVWLYRQLRVYQYDDLGVVQKWAMVLLVYLAVFDDPLYAWKTRFGSTYAVIKDVCGSTFVALMLFFWALIIHSIVQLLTLRPRQFYWPKVAIAGVIWLYLLFRQQIPTDSRRFLGFSLFTVYFTYMLFIIVGVLQVLKNMKKSYKTLVKTSIAVVMVSTLLLTLNQEIDPIQMPLFQIAQYSLFNAYLIMVAYMYSPTVIARDAVHKRPDTSQLHARQEQREKAQIMSSFYAEMELPDVEEDREALNKRQREDSQRRRDIKQDPSEKAKAQIWESIMSQKSDSDSDEDDDLDQI